MTAPTAARPSPLDDDEDDRAPWEPRSFAVGDRVRVLARPECHYCREEGDREAGQIGTVIATGHSDWMKRTSITDPSRVYFLAHRYWVQLDDLTISPNGDGVNHFAAAELVLADHGTEA